MMHKANKSARHQFALVYQEHSAPIYTHDFTGSH